MKARKFTEADYPIMVSWYKERQKNPPPFGLLPEIGFIVDNLAASFLYRMEKGLGWSDGTITNPSAPSEARAEAVVTIFGEICTVAKAEGLRMIISSTKVPNIVKYAKQIGCQVNEGITTIIKDLR